MAEQGKYAKMTSEQFDDAVRNLAERDGMSVVLDIPGVLECVSEYYNNDALELWEEQHPDLVDEDAPRAGNAGEGDLVFLPGYNGIALQSPYSHVVAVNGKEGMSTYNVDLANGDQGVPIEFYDSAWFISDDYAESLRDESEGEGAHDAATADADHGSAA